jgi:hypothetical protein
MMHDDPPAPGFATEAALEELAGLMNAIGITLRFVEPGDPPASLPRLAARVAQLSGDRDVEVPVDPRYGLTATVRFDGTLIVRTSEQIFEIGSRNP